MPPAWQEHSWRERRQSRGQHASQQVCIQQLPSPHLVAAAQRLLLVHLQAMDWEGKDRRYWSVAWDGKDGQ